MSCKEVAEEQGDWPTSSGITRKFIWQDLDGNITVELTITSLIDLAHAAFAEQSCDFVRAELLPNCDRHEKVAQL